MRRSVFLLLLLAAGHLASARQPWKFSGPAQGTTYQVLYYADRPLISRQDIEKRLSRIDASMSLYDPTSRIRAFNASQKGIRMDRYFKEVMLRAFQINRDSRGRMDVSIQPLMELWGFFGPRPGHAPDRSAVERTLRHVGMDLLEIRGDSLVKAHPDVRIDLNGIAQGYTVDVLAELLEEAGIRDYLVELGGEIRVSGRKPQGGFFTLGVEGPGPDGKPHIKHTLKLTSGALTTSGSYRQYIDLDSVRYTHILDPRTGYPVSGSILSVTLYSPDAITADGYDNVLMGMRVKQALRFVARREHLEVYLVYRDRKGHIKDTMSPGFKTLLEKNSI